MNPAIELALEQAAETLASADALLIGAGAGMGVDSGLPDFRGDHGFWRAYPPYERLGLGFTSLANPSWFVRDPAFAWGFYGHRLNLYRNTQPHEGFAILRRWSSRLGRGSFVLTSNVDGQFQRAGFADERVYEAHGAIDWLQCLEICRDDPFPADGFAVAVDPETMRAADPLPSCPFCGALARPNILMFGDRGWDSSRAEAQRSRLASWLRSVRGSRIVVVECGAGSAIPTVRMACEDLVEGRLGTLIRINPRESRVPAEQIGLPLGAREALRAIEARLGTV